MKKHIYLLVAISMVVSACDNLNLETDKPAINFAFSSSNNFKAPATIQFQNFTTDAIVQSWNFGNQQSSAEESPSVTYILPGTYTVTLSASATGGNINSQSQLITIDKAVEGNFKALYYTDATTERIYRIVLDGTSPIAAELPISSIIPSDVLVDANSKRIYYTDASANGRISRSDLDGQNWEHVLSVADDPIVNIPQGIALVDGKIYWSRFNQKIYRADLDGSNLELFDSTKASFPADVTYGNNWIYWTTENGGIYRKGLDSLESELIIPNVKSGAVAIDSLNGKIYFGDDRGSSLTGVYRADLNGANMEKIANDVRYLRGIALDVDAGKIYWSARDRGDTVGDSNSKIVRANLDGSDAEDWITGIYPYAIAIDQVKR